MAYRDAREDFIAKENGTEYWVPENERGRFGLLYEASLGLCFCEIAWPTADVVVAVAKRCSDELIWIAYDFRAKRFFLPGEPYQSILLNKMRGRHPSLSRLTLPQLLEWLEKDGPRSILPPQVPVEIVVTKDAPSERVLQ